MTIMETSVFESPLRGPMIMPLCLTFVVLVLYFSIGYQKGLPLPPGPKSNVPFVGVLFDIPKKHAFKKFTEWAQ